LATYGIINGMSNSNVNVSDEIVKSAKNENVSLGSYKGDVLLVVNVASKCGHTPQYAGLESLYKQYQDRGFKVLGFPCNQFGGQEPGTMDEILSFCSTNYNVTFPIFQKVEVNGAGRTPLYAKLTSVPPTGDIGWNFEKFLIDRNGNVVARFSPKTKPDDPALVQQIEGELAK